MAADARLDDYAIRFTPKAAKQVRRLAPAAAGRIRGFLEHKLAQLDNLRLLGKKLMNEEFWQYRVGDYRLPTSIDGDQILIIEVTHRREVYHKLCTQQHATNSVIVPADGSATGHS